MAHHDRVHSNALYSQAGADMEVGRKTDQDKRRFRRLARSEERTRHTCANRQSRALVVTLRRTTIFAQPAQQNLCIIIFLNLNVSTHTAYCNKLSRTLSNRTSQLQIGLAFLHIGATWHPIRSLKRSL